jgi:hypothetical protein
MQDDKSVIFSVVFVALEIHSGPTKVSPRHEVLTRLSSQNFLTVDVDQKFSDNVNI